MFSRKRFFLFLTPNHADLWRQRGRILDKIETLSTTTTDYTTQLKQTLAANRAYRIGLLLNLPDLTVQAEATPAVGLLDRRKLVARRLDYLFPRAALKGAKIGKGKTQLAALRPHAALTETLQAIVGVGTELCWIAHTALEATRLIPKELQTTPYICVLKLGDSGLLLAGENGILQAVRHLPADTSLPDEIRSTFAYLQRHGWQHTRDLAFIGFGVDLPTVPGLTFARTALYPTADGNAELLAQVVQSRSPYQPLTQPKLRRRKYLRTIRHALSYAAMAAAALTIGCFVACWHLFGSIETQNLKITRSMSSLPPPLAIQDLPLLKRLQHALDAPLTLAATLPNDAIESIHYQATPLESDESYSLTITSTSAPALADWTLISQPNAMPISGTIGKAAKLQPESYAYTYAVQP